MPKLETHNSGFTKGLDTRKPLISIQKLVQSFQNQQFTFNKPWYAENTVFIANSFCEEFDVKLHS